MTVAYKDTDPATDYLLDFIAGGVPTNQYGESAGNYDATFGDIEGNNYGDLSKKTLAQIYAMQSEMLAANGISTATGRYQALKSTLEEYQRRGGIASSELFTEVMQDDFGLSKLIDRGYQQWWRVEIDDDELMHRLSCEWASLPDPKNNGKSHYDGDTAGNHASTSLDNFRAAVRQTRALIDSEEAPPRGLPILMTARQGIEEIQRVLVLTGDLGVDDVDGIWGEKSETALNELVARAG
jgi:muramidase (phage lysozyme)